MSHTEEPTCAVRRAMQGTIGDSPAVGSAAIKAWFEHVKDAATKFDAEDPLRPHRSAFHFPVCPEGQRFVGHPHRSTFLYFVGNSLGLQHADVERSVVAELHKWRTQACEGHFESPNPWFEIDEVLRDDMATIVGAKRSEVVIMNSLTVNLHLLLATFYRPQGQRRKILCERFPFPSDTHALISQLAFHGLTAADLLEVDGDRSGREQSSSQHAPVWEAARLFSPGFVACTSTCPELASFFVARSLPWYISDEMAHVYTTFYNAARSDPAVGSQVSDPVAFWRLRAEGISPAADLARVAVQIVRLSPSTSSIEGLMSRFTWMRDKRRSRLSTRRAARMCFAVGNPQ